MSIHCCDLGDWAAQDGSCSMQCCHCGNTVHCDHRELFSTEFDTDVFCHECRKRFKSENDVESGWVPDIHCNYCGAPTGMKSPSGRTIDLRYGHNCPSCGSN